MENEVRTDVVGGLRAIASVWLDAHRCGREADIERDRLKAERDNILSRQEDAAKRLMERVGRNVPAKVFVFGNEAVVVEFERGIRIVPVEVE